MKAINVTIKIIEFTDPKEACQTKNYPHSGFFIVRVNGEVNQSDLRTIDKSIPTTQMVMPETLFNGLVMSNEIKFEENLPVTELKSMSGTSDNDFILEFSKILLSKK
jgi:hypothetical protein